MRSIHSRHYLTWSERFRQNAHELVANGYYMGLHRGKKAPSLVKQLKRFTVIAEVKPGSPNEGVFEERDLLSLIGGNAQALSVLTEPNYFKGSVDNLHRALDYGVPILMKDIIVSEFQIPDFVSAILLIRKFLSEAEVEYLMKVARERGVEVLLEVDNREDYEEAVSYSPDIIGINNRNLETMQIDPLNAEKILSEGVLDIPTLALSGYSTREDILRVRSAGAAGVIVGTALSRSERPASRLEEITP